MSLVRLHKLCKRGFYSGSWTQSLAFMNGFNLGLFIYTTALVLYSFTEYPWLHHEDDCNSTSWLCNIIIGAYLVVLRSPQQTPENQRSSMADRYHICDGVGPFSKLLDIYVCYTLAERQDASE